MTTKQAIVPQKLFAITLGVQDIKKQRAFYEAWGWQPVGYSTEEYVAFDVGGLMLAFYSTDELAKEAAPGAPAPKGDWKAITLAVNTSSKEECDQTWRNAVAAGATAVGEPVDRPWGGRSGYFADPEGNRWEVAWVPPALLASS